MKKFTSLLASVDAFEHSCCSVWCEVLHARSHADVDFCVDVWEHECGFEVYVREGPVVNCSEGEDDSNGGPLDNWCECFEEVYSCFLPESFHYNSCLVSQGAVWVGFDAEGSCKRYLFAVRGYCAWLKCLVCQVE